MPPVSSPSVLSSYKLVPVRAGSGARLASREERGEQPGSGSCGGRGGSWRQAHLCLSLSHNLICILSLNLSLSVHNCRTTGTHVTIHMTE